MCNFLMVRLDFGTSYKALTFLSSYLKDYQQRSKFESSFYCWHDIIRDVPKESAPDPPSCDHFKNNTFFLVENL